MMNKIQEYREKHKKCKWCKYYKYNSPSSKIWIECSDYESCTLKDKIIHFTDWKTFCRWYEPKEEKNNEI